MCVKNLKIEPAARAVQRERPSVQTSRGTNETISLERERKMIIISAKQTYRQPLITRPIFVFNAFSNEERPNEEKRRDPFLDQKIRCTFFFNRESIFEQKFFSSFCEKVSNFFRWLFF